MRKTAKFVISLALFLLPACAFAADLAILQNGFSIRHERREVLGTITRLYTSSDGISFVDIPTADIERYEKDLSPPPASPGKQSRLAQPVQNFTPQDLNQVINSISERHHLDPDFINSVIHAESGFNSRAVSKKGAQGLMQLMPGTASQLGVNNAFDPQDNVEGGTRYLRELLERYNFDIVKALAAYNAGPQRVEQYHGVPPYYETRLYVARIIRDFNRKKLAEQKAATAAKANKTAAPAKAAAKSSPPASR